MKKLLTILLTVSLLVSILPCMAFAAVTPDGTISLAMNDEHAVTLHPGETGVKVDVKIKTNVGLGTKFEIKYDKAVIKNMSITDSDTGISQSILDTDAGTINDIWLSYEAVSNATPVLTMTFDVASDVLKDSQAANYITGLGCPFTITVKELNDMQEAPISLSNMKTDPAKIAVSHLWDEGTIGDEAIHYACTYPQCTATYDQPKEKEIIRLAGSDRHTTAQAIALAAYSEGAQGAIIARSENFPDALAATALAGVKDYPIVLTLPGELVSAAKETLNSLNPSHSKDFEILIAGSENAITATVANQLSTYGTVKRMAGPDRFSTAEKIYENGIGGWGDTAVIATGMNYPDALSIAGVSFANKYPIFLCSLNGLTAASKQLISSGGFNQIVLVGSTDVVPASIETWAKNLVGKSNVIRLAGTDRFGTSSQIADWAIANGADANKAAVATGINFPDALAGGVLQGKNNSVTLLVYNGDVSTLDVVKNHKDKVWKAYIFGSPDAVSKDIENKLKKAME